MASNAAARRQRAGFKSESAANAALRAHRARTIVVGASALARNETPRTRVQRTRSAPLKRAFDILVSALGLIVLLPPMGIIAVLVLATSAGPAIHTSLRIGRYGKPFSMPKFRTMRVDSPNCPREQLADAAERVTLVGRVLRRTGLDELPQLVSVLRGDMSLIGPRPLLVDDPGAAEREKFPDALAIRPGISGLAQVSGRNLVSPRRKARLDAFYARHPSLRFDLVLVARTLQVVVTGKGFL
jgi:O-antigen biosynthesis protein WbqP